MEIPKVLVVIFIALPLLHYLCLFHVDAKSKTVEVDLVFQNETENNVTSSNQTEDATTMGKELLQQNVTPLNYTLKVRPILVNPDPDHILCTTLILEAPASVAVRFLANEESRVIVLHQKKLNIQTENVSVVNVATGHNQLIAKHTFHNNTDLYVIYLEDPFKAGDILEIYIPYIIPVYNCYESEGGLYWDTYVDRETNQTKFFATTKMEIFGARALFPVFDEVGMKANFRIIIGRVIDGGYHTLSNMERSFSELDLENPGWVWDYFEETPPLSPHNIVILVSDFANTTEPEHFNNQSIRVQSWGPLEFIRNGGGKYIMEIASKIIYSYQEKFKTPYPLQKLDILHCTSHEIYEMPEPPTLGVIYVALSWEEIESGLPKNYSQSELKYIDSIVSRQIAAQWFGIMISCNPGLSSPKGILLGKGLTMYPHLRWGMKETLQREITDGIDARFITSSKIPELDLEGLYEYGQSFFIMMENFLRPDILETSLNDNLLTKMKWREVNYVDILASIQKAVEFHNATGLLPSETSVRDIMDDWIYTDIHPILTVEVVGNETISISQQPRLDSLGEEEAQATHSWENLKQKSWWIPFKLISENGTSPTLWLPKQNQTNEITFFHNSTEKWLLINSFVSASYWVTYGPKMTTAIVDQLLENHTVIKYEDRSCLLQDYFALAKAGYAPIEGALELTRYLGKEIYSTIWGIVPQFYNIKDDTNASLAYKKYFLPRIEQALGVEDGSVTRTEANYWQMIRWCADLKGPACLQLLVDSVAKQQADPVVNKYPFPGMINADGYCYAEAGDKNGSVWDYLMKRLEEEPEDGDNYSYLHGLICTTNVTRLSQILEMTFNKSSLVGPWAASMFIQLSVYNGEALPFVYDFLKTNLLAGKAYPRLFSAFVQFGIAKRSRYPPGLEDDLRQFLKLNETLLAPAKAELEEALNKMEKCEQCKWWDTTGNRVHAWLEKQVI